VQPPAVRLLARRRCINGAFTDGRCNIRRTRRLAMRYLKVRLFALVLILLFAGMTYYNWHQLYSEGKYSLKMAAFGPVGVVGGLFLLVFPSKVGKPQTTTDKLIVLGVFIVGLIAGLANWYLMDPGFFGK
jgi:hypothetical protein